MSEAAASVAAVARPPAALSAPRGNPVVLGVAGLLFAALLAAVAGQQGWRQAALLAIGGAFGLVLYHAAFGFTSAWRVFIADRRGAGLRAQMVMLAVGCALFFPTLAGGTLFGQPVGGFVAPAGASVLVGAFLFGIGMQLGGGCGSGTLYTVGGGSARMVVTLALFVIGSVAATAHLHWWHALPSLPPVSAVASLGTWPALALHLTLFAAIAAATAVLERRRHGRLVRPAAASDLPWRRRLLRGPWPLLAGAVALAALNFATLALAGHPWGITSAFALWGAKLFAALGIDVAAWPHWAARGGQAAIDRSVLADTVSVMDFGVVLGALAAAALAGRFAPTWRIPLPSLLAAVGGGLLLGYGARLAFGCNVGAYFGGIVSGSLHGWLWLAAAFAGNILGTRLRPLFGLAVERTAERGRQVVSPARHT